MALRQIMFAKNIEAAEQKLKDLRDKDGEFETREKELETSIGEAKTDEERKVVEEEVDKFNKEKEAHEAARSRAEEELAGLKEELRRLNEKNPQGVRGEKNVKKRVDQEELEDARRGINEFVRTKGQIREGFTSVEGGALIPEELLTPQKKPEEEVDLRNYVKVVSVSGASGKYPVISKSNGKMHTVEELAANPKLANPVIKEIDYKIATRRGYIPISQEMIDDADYDVTGLIRDEINSQSLNTSNADIAAKLKTAPAKAVVGIDGVKDLVNKDIKKVYPVKFIVSSSLYAEWDKLKDNNGRYLMQDSITASSGKMILGREVVVLDDEMIGNAKGDQVGFVGDAKSFVTFFDRKRTSVEWVDNQIYGKLLAGIVRYDVRETDTDAGFYITYNEDENVQGA
jgi:HK97 family phage major capsid protein